MSSERAPNPGPDHEEPEHGLKRRQSDEPDDTGESKRQRMSPGKSSPLATRDNGNGTEDTMDTPVEADKAEPAADTRRKSSTVDEKQRSKRLFGALLGNLRQPGDRTSKRRQEIESRRKAELQRQDDERLEDRQRRLEQLAGQRKIAQVKVDEQNMHIRQRAILDRANFLQTETEPKLSYRPWDLRDDEEGRIDDQIKDAQEQVDRELGEFNESHGRGSMHGNTIARESEMQDEESHSEKDADGEAHTVPENAVEGCVQDQASAKSTEGEDGRSADAPHDVPITDAEDTNHKDDVEAEARPGSEEGNDEGEEDLHDIQEGDEDAVIY